MDNLVASNLRQRPVRAMVCAAGIALGVCLIMLFTGLANGMSNDLQRRSSNLRAEIIFTRPGSTELISSTANLDTRYAERLREIEGVAAAVPVIRYVFEGGRGFGFEQVEGVDWAAFAAMNGMRITEGRPPVATNEIVIDETRAREGNRRVGDALSLFGTEPYSIVGIYAPESGARVKMSLTAMQDALQAPGKATYILVKAADGVEPAILAERINTELPGNRIQFTRDVMGNVMQQIPYLSLFLRVLVGLAAVISALVVMLAMYTTITERTREIGILKALGASRGYIIGVIEREALLISVIGLIVGFIVSLLAGHLIQRAYGLIFEYSWTWALTAAVIGLLGGALGALYPAMRAASLDTVNALSYE